MRKNSSLLVYWFSKEARWYWLTASLTSLSSFLAFNLSDNSFPLIYIKYIFGLLFILWLPGYTFMRVMFPRKFILMLSPERFSFLEHFALSLCLSIILTSSVTLLLNYTSWGINLASVTLSVTALIMVLATFALLEEYAIIKDKRRESND
ncbi:MAG: DUF1616 domain-containing protein [Candidatus Bathyarchaeia archaeon]